MAATKEKTVPYKTKFKADLHNQLAKETDNMVMSALSLSLVMGMVLAGAKDQTAAQIQQAMYQEKDYILNGSKDVLEVINGLKNNKNFTLRVANKIFVNKAFKPLPEYLDVLKSNFFSVVGRQDFKKSPEVARQKINKWVENQTNNKIMDLLPEGFVTTETVGILVNAIYFQGDWKHQFDEANTKDSKFFITPTKVSKVKMMTQTKGLEIAYIPELDSNCDPGQKPPKSVEEQIQMAYESVTASVKLTKADKQDLKGTEFTEEEWLEKLKQFKWKRSNTRIKLEQPNSAKALRMPYINDKLDMIFILPKEGDTLVDMEENLGKVDFSHLDFKNECEVAIEIPRFKIESTHHLKDPLVSLGVIDVFDEEKADLSGIAVCKKGGNLMISDVIQKAYIQVDEGGAEAAVATGGFMVTPLCGHFTSYVLYKEFICNKPFLFMIQERKTGTILFSGKIVDPNQ